MGRSPRLLGNRRHSLLFERSVFCQDPYQIIEHRCESCFPCMQNLAHELRTLGAPAWLSSVAGRLGGEYYAEAGLVG